MGWASGAGLQDESFVEIWERPPYHGKNGMTTVLRRFTTHYQASERTRWL